MSKYKSEKAKENQKLRERKYYLENKEKCSENMKKWRKDNDESHKKQKKEYWENNRDRLNSEKRKDREENPVKYSLYKLFNRHGISLSEEETSELISSYTGLCEICGEKESVTCNGKPTSLSLDHCHETGEVRGFLCRKCNTRLDHFSDDEKLLDNAIIYLNKNKE